jgi:quercetin dioxygenase-like cupin family protein
LRLSLSEQAAGAAPAPTAERVVRVVHELDDGRTLAWELGDEAPAGALLSREVDIGDGWIMRLDRVDFEPGGIAYRHTHPGPGIRYLLFGEITIDSLGATHTLGPGEAWFERGPDPVLATTAADEPTAFVRVMLLPAEWAGKRTITYVDPDDADKPKTQRATIFLEQPVAR